MKEEQDCAEEAEDQATNEKYKTWKKNSPLLYDLLIARSLEWPSMTVDWLTSKQVNSNHSLQKLLISNHVGATNKNSLSILSVVLPLEDVLLNKSVTDPLLSTQAKIKNIITLPHEGDVNIARAMPQKDSIIASKGSTGQVYVNDWEKVLSGIQDSPTVLTGHSKEGVGLAWSGLREGCLASGSDDHNVCIWDLTTQKNSNILVWHSNIVEDVSFSEFYQNLLASAGDDRKIILWDLRQGTPSHVIEAHIHEINSVDFNKHDEYLLATASNDKSVAIWDTRNMGKKLVSLDYHQDTVHKVSWAPFSMSILASVSNDRKVLLWDLGRLNCDSQDDLPPEVLFSHNGHTGRISDFSWNPNDHFLMSSVSEDNMLQVWQMSHTLFTSESLRLGVADKEVEISN
jgi:WD40 repeat protein